MNPTEVVVAALATWQAVEVWHHSALFARWRALAELADNKVGELLLCPWCLSVWIGALVAAGMLIPAPPHPEDNWRVQVIAAAWLVALVVGSVLTLLATLLAVASASPRAIGLCLGVAFFVWAGAVGMIVGDAAIRARVAWGAFWLVRLFVYALAVSRLANLGNDMMHNYCRTPRVSLEDNDAGTGSNAADI